ncbi:uncharacterized protein Bfra_002163 [Botrytis fragariae]|uniref:Uncharacterized protein n=1 Tax=Botrytis fragariae TaxID=1964551 RepID=A0A8H6B259_9HELO|nr:uncharacterized protein Bfra_002163 [Botrytis fragariae]KAF5877795.1 hypothetical protein Bfra_002163 [Botrytis fragariae]
MSTDHRSPNSLFPPVSQPSQYKPPQRRDLPTEIPHIPDNNDSSIEWLPIYNKRTPYVEAEIVYLIHEIVRNYVRLSAVSKDVVTWPPEGGHHLDEALCNELNISDAAKSLIRLLPSGSSIFPVFLYQSSQLFEISDHGFSLRASRESPSFDEEKDPPAERYILPYDVQLSAGDPETPVIILDTRENTIRVVSTMDDGADDSNPSNAPLERPDDPCYYRNYWPRHAPSFLRIQLNRIKALDVIPPGPSALSYIDFADEWMRRKIKHSLEGTYGWPDNFNQEAWDEDRDRIWEEAEEEYERLGRPKVLRFL